VSVLDPHTLARLSGVKLRAEFVSTDRNRQMLITYKFAGSPDGEGLVPADSAGGFHSATRGWKVDFAGDSVKVSADSTTVIRGVRAK